MKEFATTVTFKTLWNWINDNWENRDPYGFIKNTMRAGNWTWIIHLYDNHQQMNINLSESKSDNQGNAVVCFIFDDPKEPKNVSIVPCDRPGHACYDSKFSIPVDTIISDVFRNETIHGGAAEETLRDLLTPYVIWKEQEQKRKFRKMVEESKEQNRKTKDEFVFNGIVQSNQKMKLSEMSGVQLGKEVNRNWVESGVQVTKAYEDYKPINYGDGHVIYTFIFDREIGKEQFINFLRENKFTMYPEKKDVAWYEDYSEIKKIGENGWQYNHVLRYDD